MQTAAVILAAIIMGVQAAAVTLAAVIMGVQTAAVIMGAQTATVDATLSAVAHQDAVEPCGHKCHARLIHRLGKALSRHEDAWWVGLHAQVPMSAGGGACTHAHISKCH